MKINKYLEHLQEGYFLSDKTISVNLYKFENGESNKLLIVGVLGSGKTTLANLLLKKYKVSNFVSDTSSDGSFKKMIKALKDNKRTIIEGSQITTMYIKFPQYRELILKQPMIIIGMSAIKAGLKADQRDGTTLLGAKNKRDIYYFIRKNLSHFQKKFNYFRKDVMKIPNVKIEEYKLPKIISVKGL